MRVTLQLLGFILATGTMVLAQKKGDIEYGLGIGLNNSSGSDHNSDDRFGGNFAIFADYYFAETWSVRAKAIYDQKGWDDTIVFGSGLPHDYGSIGNFELTYITIPVMAGYHFLPKKNGYVNVGPYFGILTDARYYDSQSKIDGIKSTDYGLSCALGIKAKVGKSKKHSIYLEVEGQFGMANVYDDSNDPNNLVNGNADTKNIRTSLNAGFIF